MIHLTEKDISLIVKKVINEVRYLGFNNPNARDWEDQYKQDPIKNNDRIRVFHGTSFANALKIAIEGVSGKEVHGRNFSYELGMNPAGLFVTTKFNTAKSFSFDNKANVIIEFTAKATDLDTPVWNNSDSYFGQNTQPQSFSSKEEREAQKKYYMDKAKNSEYDMVKNSDNPAMAHNLFLNPENQALFIGDLNPNMIKRFWVKEKGQGVNYKPLSYKQFIKKYGDEEIPEEGAYNSYYKPRKRLYYPNEEFTGWEDFAKRYIEDDPIFYDGGVTEDNINEVITSLKEFYLDRDDYSIFKDTMFPKQIIQAIGEDKYREIFNKFY